MNKEKFTRAGEKNRETPIQGELAQLVEHRHVNPEVAGSNPALVNFSLFIQNLSKNLVNMD